MNQIISYSNSKTLAKWLEKDGQCDSFRGSHSDCTNKADITAEIQQTLNMVLGGSNVARFAAGNSSKNIGVGKVTCVWKDGKCRDDVDYDSIPSGTVCNAIKTTTGATLNGTSDGECYGLEQAESWAEEMKIKCAGNSETGASSVDSSGSPNAFSDIDNSNMETIWNFLAEKGFTSVQAAGIMGVWYVESRFDPTAENGSSGAYGIAQWLGGRKDGLLKNSDYNTINTQMNYFMKELNDSYKNRSLTSRVGAQSDVPAAARAFLPDTGGQKFWSVFKDTTNIGAAVTLFFDAYECGLGSAACSRQLFYDNRLSAAKTVFNYFKDKGVISESEINTVDLGNYEMTDFTNSNLDPCEGVYGEANAMLIPGGMTVDQAISFMKTYATAIGAGTNVAVAKSWSFGSTATQIGVSIGHGGGVSQFSRYGSKAADNGQCTAFSAWFYDNYYYPKTNQAYLGGNGNEVVGRMRGINGVAIDGSMPAYAIFSKNGGTSSTMHTGVVLGVGEDGSFITGEGNYDGNGGVAVVKYPSSALNDGTWTFAYLTVGVEI
jgi:hypothetical protein